MAQKKPENTFEIRAYIPQTVNKDIKLWMINNNQTQKNISVGLIIEDYFKISQELKEIQLELTRVLLVGENGKR